jgi:hypothetical protein
VRVCRGVDNPYALATWTDTSAGQTGQGVCRANLGYTGTTTALCSVLGVWSAVATQCAVAVLPCPQSVGYAGPTGFTSWPATTAGTVATGTCASGYAAVPAGPPQRACTSTGVWNSTVVNDCVFGTAATGAAHAAAPPISLHKIGCGWGMGGWGPMIRHQRRWAEPHRQCECFER